MHTRRFELYALVGASAASLLGNVIAVVAIPWFVLATTGSSGKTGLAACVTALPLALGAAFGGAVVDRVGAKRGAARLALVPEVAARTEFSLERANSLVTAAEHVGYVLGAPLAGVLIATIATPATVWFDAGSFVLSALVVAAAAVPAAPHGRARRSVDDLADGIRFVLREPVVRLLITLVVVGTFLISPLAAVLLPVLARREFGGASSYGVMMAAYGVGGLLGTGLYALGGRRIPRRASFLGFWIAYPPVTALLVLMPAYPLVLAVLAVIAVVLLFSRRG